MSKELGMMVKKLKSVIFSAIIYSIAETTKANGLKPYEYFKYLLTEILKYLENTDRSVLDNLLPWSPDLPANCRKPDKDEVK